MSLTLNGVLANYAAKDYSIKQPDGSSVEGVSHQLEVRVGDELWNVKLARNLVEQLDDDSKVALSTFGAPVVISIRKPAPYIERNADGSIKRVSFSLYAESINFAA